MALAPAGGHLGWAFRGRPGKLPINLTWSSEDEAESGDVLDTDVQGAPESLYSSEFAKHSVYSALLLIDDCIVLHGSSWKPASPHSAFSLRGLPALPQSVVKAGFPSPC